MKFFRYKEGSTCPDGYEPEDPSDLVSDWPLTIVRVHNRETIKDPGEWVRFLGMTGKAFQCGDIRGNPLLRPEPVWVRVSDFYVLETEVTNRVLEVSFRHTPMTNRSSRNGGSRSL